MKFCLLVAEKFARVHDITPSTFKLFKDSSAAEQLSLKFQLSFNSLCESLIPNFAFLSYANHSGLWSVVQQLPLDKDMYDGGGWIYHMGGGLISLGVGCWLGDYKNPWLSPYRELQVRLFFSCFPEN